MTNHFRSVGFPFDSPLDLAAFAKTAGIMVKKWLPTDHGFYVVMGPDEGVQWIGQFNLQKQPIGGNPHYVGLARLRMRIEAIHPAAGNPLEAVLVGTLCDADDQPTGPPLPVEIADFDIFREMLSIKGTKVTLQVAAFAEQVEYFADTAEFANTQGQYQGLADEFFSPIGTFRPDGGAIDPPQPRVLMVGRVLTVLRRTNNFSDLQFWAMTILCQGAYYDVVAADEVLGATPAIGGLIAGVFYLSGQAVPDRQLRARGEPVPNHPFVQRPEFDLQNVDLIVLGEAVQEIDRWTRRCFYLALGGLVCFPLALPAFGWSAVLLFRVRKIPYPRKWKLVVALVLGGIVTAAGATFGYIVKKEEDAKKAKGSAARVELNATASLIAVAHGPRRRTTTLHLGRRVGTITRQSAHQQSPRRHHATASLTVPGSYLV
ncbi:MAG: hypothetical protein K2Y37_09015 [Pirellulales bacterium]|nr:hypothetical protein [Pirellulales bacterium]